MRVIGKLAIALAVLGWSVLACGPAMAQDSWRRVCVVDVAKIFKEHPGIRVQVEKVENDLKAYDAQMKAKQQELKAEAEKLKNFKVGSPEFAAQEEAVASMESQLRLDVNRKRKELADAEARIYYDNYMLITSAVKAMAKANGISLVLRYNSEEMDLAQGESVVRGVMKNIVYHDATLDITPYVMQILDQKLEVANAPGATTKR